MRLGSEEKHKKGATVRVLGDGKRFSQARAEGFVFSLVGRSSEMPRGKPRFMGRAWGVSKGLVFVSRVERRLNGETAAVGGFKHNLEG